jgi:AAA domain
MDNDKSKEFLEKLRFQRAEEREKYLQFMREKLPGLQDEFFDLTIESAAVGILRNMVEKFDHHWDGVTVRLSEIERTYVEWLPIDGFKIPRGEMTLIGGDPGKGKSFVALEIISRLTLNGHTALILGEDNLSNTVRPRIENMGGDVTRIRVLNLQHEALPDNRGFTLKADVPLLEQAILESKPDIVLIDPLASYTAGVDTFRGNETRALLDPCIRLARQQNFALVCIVHLNKSTGTAIQRLADSMQGVAACRSAYVMGLNPYSTERNRFVVAHAKATQGALGPSRGYRIESLPDHPDDAVLVWEDEVDIDADNLLNYANQPQDGKSTKSAIAEAILRSGLSHGPRPKSELAGLSQLEG